MSYPNGLIGCRASRPKRLQRYNKKMTYANTCAFLFLNLLKKTNKTLLNDFKTAFYVLTAAKNSIKNKFLNSFNHQLPPLCEYKSFIRKNIKNSHFKLEMIMNV